LNEQQRQRLASAGLADTDRYVRGLTVQALHHDPSVTIPVWLDRVLSYLEAGQYQPRPQ